MYNDIGGSQEERPGQWWLRIQELSDGELLSMIQESEDQYPVYANTLHQALEQRRQKSGRMDTPIDERWPRPSYDFDGIPDTIERIFTLYEGESTDQS